MKSLMRLLLCVLEDSSIWCCTSTTRDWLTIQRRVEHEGLSFLMIGLPAFCSDFERSLATGMVEPCTFLGFKRQKGTSLPAFLQGLTSRVFDASSGRLLDEPDVVSISCIRQITLMCKKILVPCSSERVKRAYVKYIECEKEVTLGFRDIPNSLIETFREVSRLLWGVTLRGPNTLVRSYGGIPRHGPGATAERISRNEKYKLRTWHERLQPFFPADLFAIPNLGYTEILDEIDFLEPEAERPVRVITVPKTLSTPRIIAIEPVCMQYTQQALMEMLVKTLESHRLTAGRINFSDQTINQRLALSSSKDGSLATIDLKDASDRVSVELVKIMLESQPDLLGAVLACRSTHADVPGHGVLPLTKFASMGSALCFPIEAMVFYTICISVVLKSQGARVSLTSLSKAGELVRVYGDDIIVPAELVQSVCCELEGFNLRVNQRKTFGTGKFRESCGVDAYDGTRVTPIYVRRMLPGSRRDTSEILSAISLANQLYAGGYWKACSYVRKHVERFIPVPYVLDTSPVKGWISYLSGYETQRMCPSLHRPLVYGATVRIRHAESILDGPHALMKAFLKRGNEPFHDKKHLERHGRPEAVDIKLRWAPPY